MTELDLYKFIEESGSMTSYDGDKAIIWVYHFWIDEFAKLIGDGLLDEGGLEVRLQQSYVAIELNEICEWHDIDISNVLEEEV